MLATKDCENGVEEDLSLVSGLSLGEPGGVDSSPTFDCEPNGRPAILSGASLTTMLVSGKAVVAPGATASSVCLRSTHGRSIWNGTRVERPAGNIERSEAPLQVT